MGLDADTFLPIIQRDTVAAVIVAALMYQPPRSAVLAVVHDGDGFRLAFLHAGTSHTPPQLPQLWQAWASGSGPVGRVCRFRLQEGKGQADIQVDSGRGKIVCFIRQSPSMSEC